MCLMELPFSGVEKGNVEEKTDICAALELGKGSATLNDTNHVLVQIQDKYIWSLLDSGAGMNYLSKSVLSGLDPKPKLVPVANVDVRTATGSSINIAGKCHIPVTIGGVTVEVLVYVSSDIQFSLILGNKFLRDNCAVIDFAHKELQVHPRIEIVAEEQVTLSPQMQCCVIGQLLGGVIDSTVGVVMKPENWGSLDAKIGTKGDSDPVGCLQAFDTAVTVKNSKVPVILKNNSETHVDIAKGHRLGTFEFLSPGSFGDEGDDLVSGLWDPDSGFEPRNEQFYVCDKVCGLMGDSQIREGHSSNSILDNVSWDKDNLSPGQTARLGKLLNEYSDVFVNPATGKLGRTSLMTYHIDLVEGAKPVKCKPYRTGPQQKEIIEKKMKELEEQGIITESNTPWNSPLLLVKKKDGSWRVVIDYRKCNLQLETHNVPLVRIDDSLMSLGKKNAFFSSIDLASGFWQIPLDEESQPITGFVTHNNTYSFTVLPMGLKSSPTVFSRFMTRLLKDFIGDFCQCFLDDVLIHSEDFDSHMVHLEKVLAKFREANLTLKPSKCDFAQKEIKYLGHVVSEKGISPDPTKVEIVKNYPVPRTVKEVRAFLGLASYYRRHINHFATIANPLHELLKKEAKFIWDDGCQKAFETLRDALVNPPILAYPDFTKKFVLHTDASLSGLGAVLTQEQDGTERVIAYAAKSLNRHQKNYTTTEKELLALIFGIKHFRPYLSCASFLVVTDHVSLSWLLKLENASSRLARWVEYLSQFDFTVQHRAGKKHQNADTLSRIPLAPDNPNHQFDDENLMATRELIRPLKIPPNTRLDPEKPLHQEIQNMIDVLDAEEVAVGQIDDPDFKHIYRYCKLKELPSDPTLARNTLVQAPDYLLIEDILYRVHTQRLKGTAIADRHYLQLVIPKTMIPLVLELSHDSMAGGHFGFAKTHDKMRMKYYWKNMLADIREYISSCEACQVKKAPVHKQKSPLIPITDATEAWEMISSDIVGPLPCTARGNKYIIVFTDLFTKYAEAFPLKNIEAKTVANVFLDEIVFRYSSPKKFLTDQGSNYTSKVMHELCKLLRIKKLQTTPYHPMTNGQSENFNKTLISMISKYINDQQTDWDTYLRAMVHAYNSTPLSHSIGYTPHYMLFGSEARDPLQMDLLPDGNASKNIYTHISELVDRLEKAHKVARHRLVQHQKYMQKQYDRTMYDHNFHVGSHVYLHTMVVKKGTVKKLSKSWLGPFIITEKVSPVNFRLKWLQTNKRFKPIVHSNRLKLAHVRSLRPRDNDMPNDTDINPANIVQEDDANPYTEDDLLQFDKHCDSATQSEEKSIPSTHKQQSHTAVDANDSMSNGSNPAVSRPNTSSVTGTDEGPKKINTQANADGSSQTRNPARNKRQKKRKKEEQYYEIEDIKARKFENGTNYFLIKWKHFPPEHNTWEPEINLNKHTLRNLKLDDIPLV